MTALDRPPRSAHPLPDAPGDGGGVDGVTVAFLVVGLVPIVGFLLGGTWPAGDLGVAVVFVLFAGFQLLRHWRHRR